MGIRAFDGVAACRDAAQKPAIEAVHDLLPVDVCIGEEAVEHVFLAGEHLTYNAPGIVASALDGEKREQDYQLKDLTGRELAVRSLGKFHLPLVQSYMTHHIHHSLDRHRIVTFSKKSG